jgi:hypothetical protein
MVRALALVRPRLLLIMTHLINGPVGKHISMLEMTKFLPQLFRQFKLEWTSTDDEWKITGYWFAKQSGVIMRVLPREQEKDLV